MSNLKEIIMEKREMFIGLGCMMVALVVFGGGYINNQSKVVELENTRQSIADEILQKEAELLAKQTERTDLENEIVAKQTGLDLKVVRDDAKATEDFFKRAFSWESGKEYDEIRSDYLKELGPDNSFTKSYLPENLKIDTNDGPLSYVDGKSLKSMFRNIQVTPLVAEGNTINYMAVVEYIVYTSKDDINNPSALAPSNAIIMYTVYDDVDDKRQVKDVRAWNGQTMMSNESNM